MLTCRVLDFAAQRRLIEFQYLETLLPHAELVLDQQIDQLLTVDERDRRGTMLEGSILRALRKAARVDDCASHRTEAMERSAQRIQHRPLDVVAMPLDLDDLTHRGDPDLDVADHIDALVIGGGCGLDFLVAHLLQEPSDKVLKLVGVHPLEMVLQT